MPLTLSGLIPLLCTLHLHPYSGEPVRLTVVIVLAHDRNNIVDPRLGPLAKEVQKRDPELIGYSLDKVMQKSLFAGEAIVFPITEKIPLTVIVQRSRDLSGRVELTLKIPDLPPIRYKCVCNKYFPVVTPHILGNGARLIVAIMAKPCTAHSHR